jgi:hypothetical protein
MRTSGAGALATRRMARHELDRPDRLPAAVGFITWLDFAAAEWRAPRGAAPGNGRYTPR